MKIFEIVEYTDGGPNDKGDIIGFVKAISEKEAKKKFGLKSNFIQAREISLKQYEGKKQRAKNYLKLFTI